MDDYWDLLEEQHEHDVIMLPTRLKRRLPMIKCFATKCIYRFNGSCVLDDVEISEDGKCSYYKDNTEECESCKIRIEDYNSEG